MTRKFYHFINGVWSGYPICCVIAFINETYIARFDAKFKTYSPCMKCFIKGPEHERKGRDNGVLLHLAQPPDARWWYKIYEPGSFQSKYSKVYGKYVLHNLDLTEVK